MLELTKNELEQVYCEAITKLVKFCGGATHLAKMINTPISTVQSWVERGRISKAGALAVQENSKLREHFSLTDLRPDMDSGNANR